MKKYVFIALFMFLYFRLEYAGAQTTFIAPELLSRPTDNSITLNAVADRDLEVYIEYGTESGVYAHQTSPKKYPNNSPIEIIIDGLQPDTRYYYCLRYRTPGSQRYRSRDEYSFHTQRRSGSRFIFTIQADSHNYRSDPAELKMYERTLLNILADNPDFHIDLGDSFDMDTVRNANDAFEAYLRERPFYGKITHSSPLFFVLGNHENEEGWHRTGTANNLAIWSVNARKTYYPNPVPNGFYTGNSNTERFVTGNGLPENYYSWQWGDALFVVLDPYWNTAICPYDEDLGDDNWRWTLGYDQYEWLRQIIEQNTARFKFVFAHHVTGGVTVYGRGGIEAAPYYEWGV